MNVTKRLPIGLPNIFWIRGYTAAATRIFTVILSDAKLHRHQRKTYVAIQGRLSEYWAMYAADDLTTSALLRKCSHVYGPVNQ